MDEKVIIVKKKPKKVKSKKKNLNLKQNLPWNKESLKM